MQRIKRKLENIANQKQKYFKENKTNNSWYSIELHTEDKEAGSCL